MQVDLADMSVISDDDVSSFDDNLSDILHRIEGISHFTIDKFYSFDYLNSYAVQNDPTYVQLISHWHDVMNGYNSAIQL